MALARAGAGVGGADHRVGGAAGLGGRVLRDQGPVGQRAPGRGDWFSRLQCSCRCRWRDGGHSLRRSGGGAGHASRDRGGRGADGPGAECAGGADRRGTALRPSFAHAASGGNGAIAAGPGADSHAAGHGNSRDRCAADRGPGTASGHLRRLGRGQEHADRHDDAQHRGRCDGGGPGGRAGPRGGRVS